MIRVDGDHWIKTVSTIMYITSVKPHPLLATQKPASMNLVRWRAVPQDGCASKEIERSEKTRTSCQALT